MIKLTATNGKPVYVEAGQVIAINPYAEHTIVWLSAQATSHINVSLQVKEGPEEIHDQLTRPTISS